MKPLDNNYLSLQFKNKILLKSGTEFQTFFEDIMEKAFFDFQKIRPYGNMGDGGNDGFREKIGVYYQVYAPIDPRIKDAEAARKIHEDFQKLKIHWSGIAKIKEYNFVLNDKYGGTIQLLEKAKGSLKKDNPDIDFKLFLANDLEKVFFELNDSDILRLGFSIDQRDAISNAYAYMKNVSVELDRENVNFAQKILVNSKDIVSGLNDESLSLEYEILECRCLRKLERVDEAKRKYKNLSKRFPEEPRSFLGLAEIYLNDNDFDKNKEFLEKAERIDDTFWLLKIGQLIRKFHLREKFDPTNIIEKNIPYDPKIKANFYRLYALFYEGMGNSTKADSYIEKAIYLNPDMFLNYFVKLSLIENRLFLCQDISLKLNKSQELLEEVEEVENKFIECGDIGDRNKALLNLRKIHALWTQENIPRIEKISQKAFRFLLSCYFDKIIEYKFIDLLNFVCLPNKDLNQLLEYLKKSKKAISDDLSKELIIQFYINKTLFSAGKKFFEETTNQKYFDFVSDLENKNYEKILKLLENDIPFAVTIASTFKNIPELREKIIEKLPDDKNIQKQKLLLLLNFDDEDFDEAFKILKQIDLSSLSYIECRPILQIVQKKNAWDFEIIILQKLLEKEINEKKRFELNLQLLSAYLNLEKHPDVIELGEQLLQEDSEKNILDPKEKEALLNNTIIACFERGKIDKKIFTKSKELLGKYSLAEPSFEFKTGTEARLYLNNNEAENALKSVTEGIKIKKVLSPNEYAKLYFLLVIEIVGQTGLTLDSLDKVKENSFVKLRNKDQWYFIGDDNELDAIPIPKTSTKYQSFIDRMVGDKIVFEHKYNPSKNREEVVCNIFSIEKYVTWQTVQNFQKLSKDGDLDYVQMIEMPQKEETIDFENLLKFLGDLHKRTEPFFKIYCKDNIPLSMLAMNEGGLTDAIGLIQQENKGFINCSNGTIEEFEKQKEIAKNVIAKKMPFYIDGTSALFLSEIGVFHKIHNYLPNLKVPQSVINLLADITDKFGDRACQYGHLGYVQGKIHFSSIEKDKRDLIQSNFIASINILELKPENIGVISSANKMDCFLEKEVPDELCDACILAQKEDLPLLTEDFLYLTMNQLQTEKKKPEYFSSLALMRVLYEGKQLNFSEYLEYFGYLSSYRFKFLFFDSDDIEKAVFGDEKIKTVSPENVRKFNFSLTLSEEYGVQTQTAFTVLGRFLFKVLMDNAVTVDIAEKIFIEIIESLPTEMNKKDFGQTLLRLCYRTIEDKKSKLIIVPNTHLIHEKIDKLQQATEIYAESKIWMPN
jgi:hypothetical protein